jgi:hypothetical protein
MLAIPHLGEGYSAAQLRGLRASKAGHVTLDDIQQELLRCGFGQWHYQNLGGNVYGLVDYSGLTLTIDGGLDVSSEPQQATLLICSDGAEILSCDVLDASAAVMAYEDALYVAGL